MCATGADVGRGTRVARLRLSRYIEARNPIWHSVSGSPALASRGCDMESTSGVTSLPLQGHRPVAVGFGKCRGSIKKVTGLAEPYFAWNWRGDWLRNFHHHRNGNRGAEAAS